MWPNSCGHEKVLARPDLRTPITSSLDQDVNLDLDLDLDLGSAKTGLAVWLGTLMWMSMRAWTNRPTNRLLDCFGLLFGPFFQLGETGAQSNKTHGSLGPGGRCSVATICSWCSHHPTPGLVCRPARHGSESCGPPIWLGVERAHTEDPNSVSSCLVAY